jgi:hypothetical protein
MPDESKKILHLAVQMAERMRVFRKLAIQAMETDSRIDLDPREFWEPKDQAVLDRFDTLMVELSGVKPLFESEDLAEFPFSP